MRVGAGDLVSAGVCAGMSVDVEAGVGVDAGDVVSASVGAGMGVGDDAGAGDDVGGSARETSSAQAWARA